MDLPFIFGRKIKTVQRNGNRFSLTDAETVFLIQFPGQNVMGIHKHPGGVFIAQGIPDLPVRQGTPEPRILIEGSGQSGHPGRPDSVTDNIIR